MNKAIDLQRADDDAQNGSFLLPPIDTSELWQRRLKKRKIEENTKIQ